MSTIVASSHESSTSTASRERVFPTLHFSSVTLYVKHASYWTVVPRLFHTCSPHNIHIIPKLNRATRHVCCGMEMLRQYTLYQSTLQEFAERTVSPHGRVVHSIIVSFSWFLSSLLTQMHVDGLLQLPLSHSPIKRVNLIVLLVRCHQ
jgi:hypothetical protein